MVSDPRRWSRGQGGLCQDARTVINGQTVKTVPDTLPDQARQLIYHPGFEQKVVKKAAHNLSQSGSGRGESAQDPQKSGPLLG